MMSWASLMSVLLFFFFKQKTAYEMRISDWSSDVCSSDLGVKRIGHRTETRIAIGLHVVEAHAATDDQHAIVAQRGQRATGGKMRDRVQRIQQRELCDRDVSIGQHQLERNEHAVVVAALRIVGSRQALFIQQRASSEEHPSELQ